MSDDEREQQKWLGVIAKTLCYLALHYAKLEEKPVLTKVEFLGKLGLDTVDAAHVVGSSAASVAELRRQAKNRSKKSRGGRGSKGAKARKKGR